MGRRYVVHGREASFASARRSPRVPREPDQNAQPMVDEVPGPTRAVAGEAAPATWPRPGPPDSPT